MRQHQIRRRRRRTAVEDTPAVAPVTNSVTLEAARLLARIQELLEAEREVPTETT